MREHGSSRFLPRLPQSLLPEALKYFEAYSKNCQALSIINSSFLLTPPLSLCSDPKMNGVLPSIRRSRYVEFDKMHFLL